MSESNPKLVKSEVIALAKQIWESDAFKLKDTERTRKFRKDILERLLTSVMTDDERAELHGLPEGCRMREGAKIISPENLKCGEYVWIGENAVLDASGHLEIGSHTSIGLSVFVWTHTSALANLMMSNFVGNKYISRKKTRIGSGCFISGPSVIYPGVTIGDKCIILPNSVVTKDMPSNSVIGGNPAVIQSEMNDRKLKKMLSLNGIQE